MPETPDDSSTLFPKTPISRPVPQLDDATWNSLGITISILIDINLGNRNTMDTDLDVWNAIYEMRSQRRNLPWEGAANLVLPTAFTAANELSSRIIGTCLVERPYMIRGNDPVSSQYAHLAEQFHNGEYERNRDFEAFETAIDLAVLDGTSIMSVLYDYSTHQEVFEEDEPVLDDNGRPVLDRSGNPRTKKVQKLATFVDYDAPRLIPIDLKSFLLVPNFATSIDKADGRAPKQWLSEIEIMRMVNSGLFREDMCDEALRYTNTGMGEQSYDPQGNSQYTINNRIPIVDTAVANPENIPMTRGPLEVYPYYTDSFDLNGDGVPEKNVFWIHYRSRKMLGFAPFDYMGGWPFKVYRPIPRRNLFYGFSAIEIARSTQEEKDVQRNSRLDLLDMSLKPQRWHTKAVKFLGDGNKKWDPETDLEIDGNLLNGSAPKDQLGFVPIPDVPPQSADEENSIQAILDRALGSPQVPGNASSPIGGAQQRSARAAQLSAQIQAMQTNRMMKRTRQWMADCLKYKNGLYVRYGADQLQTVSDQGGQPQRIVVPREILGLDYSFGISGMGGTLDKEGRRDSIAMITQLLLSTPMQALVAGNMVRLWNLARLNLETQDIPDVTSIIGTLEEAVQLQQSQAQSQQEQTQLAALMQVLSHSKGHVGGGNGAASNPLAALGGGGQ